ncbi:hypothetical protein H0H87_008605 [Tephrocybe sp. NHM501043]|nr:hypothetical protein H0H87_008605 [Tephrocybe sp. NHM501043]
MGEKCALKEEENDTFAQLYTMHELPPYPDLPQSNETPFGNWSFSNASQNVFYSPLHFHSTLDITCSGDNSEVQPTPASHHDQPNTDLSENLSLDITSPISPTSTFSSSPSKTTHSHIPRPPNAFMLYRSDFLKRGVIPSHVERRQQNLSRIAGQCWNLLSQEEKVPWQELAAQVLLEHQRKNPDYKFTPAPRGSRRSKMKGRSDGDGEAVDGEERIRQIREEYARITGPTAAPTRRRRPRGQNQSRDLEATSAHKSPCAEARQYLLPPSIPPSPSPVPSPIEYKKEAYLPPFFPHHTFPQIIPPRRPSTSLGFVTGSTVRDTPSVQAGLTLARPLSAASETGLTTYMKDLDITPTAPTFNQISTPVSPTPSNGGPFPQEPPAAQQEFVFPTLDPSCSSSSASMSPAEDLSDATCSGGGSFLQSLYSDDAFAYNLPIVPAEQEFASLHETYFNYDTSAFNATWESLDTSLPLSGHLRSYAA